MNAEWATTVSELALRRMVAHAELVGLANTDESTFRSFFMAELRARFPNASLETEWRRFDLIARMDAEVCLIEFKYYIHRRGSTVDGLPAQWKGGAGAKNQREFWQCVSKLASFDHPIIGPRILVLVYECLVDSSGRNCYHSSYGQLAPDAAFDAVFTCESPPLVCKVLTVLTGGPA
ncbi:MAG: hypothetical protein IT431_14635 [Phycisphaerales bacterium]|nr:hypothetical protein [Phycisphaerales bacterium]